MLPWQLMLFSAHSVEMAQEDVCCGPDSETQSVDTNRIPSCLLIVTFSEKVL